MALRDPSQLGLLKKNKRRNKHGNQKVTLGGVNWDSKAEAARYIQLLDLVNKGVVCDLSIKPKFVFANGKIRFYPDFSYFDSEALQQVVEDVKGGPETAVFKLKAKLFEDAFKRKVRIVRMDSKVADTLIKAARGRGL